MSGPNIGFHAPDATGHHAASAQRAAFFLVRGASPIPVMRRFALRLDLRLPWVGGRVLPRVDRLAW